MKAEVTQLLQQWSDGDQEALERLMPILYDRLKRIAHNRLRNESPGRTLSTTGLVHEAYLRLVEIDRLQWKDRAHFLAIASRLMRRILIDHARERCALKRGGGAPHEEFNEDLFASRDDAARLLDLNDALERLEADYPRKGKAAEMYFFGGLTLEETARAIDVSPATAMRDIRFSEAWIARAWSGPGTNGHTR